MEYIGSSIYLGNYIYIVSAGLFILSLKWMNSPATARRGVFAGETGMLLAIVGTLLSNHILNWEWIVSRSTRTPLALAAPKDCPSGFGRSSASPR